jgi:hypothetical protein
MRNITRRAAMFGAAVSSAALAIPAVAAVKPTMTAEQRRAYHLAEFKRACEEIDPMIGSWPDGWDRRDKNYGLYAHRVTGRYAGDGIYESGRVDALGERGPLTVTLTPERIDDERTFFVTRAGRRTRMTETLLENSIGRKLPL